MKHWTVWKLTRCTWVVMYKNFYVLCKTNNLADAETVARVLNEAKFKWEAKDKAACGAAA